MVYKNRGRCKWWGELKGNRRKPLLEFKVIILLKSNVMEKFRLTKFRFLGYKLSMTEMFSRYGWVGFEWHNINNIKIKNNHD